MGEGLRRVTCAVYVELKEGRVC